MPRLRTATVLDLLLAIGLGSMAQAMVWSGQVAGSRSAMSVLFLLVGLPLALRRSRPLVPVVAFCIAICVQALATSYSAEGAPLVLAYFAASYSIAAYGNRREASAGLALVVLTYGVSLWQDPLVQTPEEKWAAAFFGLLPALAWVAGLGVRGWRERRLVEQVAAQHEVAHAAAVADEQARIARELHDVIAHHVNVVVLQSVAAQGVLEAEPRRAGPPLAEIERSGREALSELRRLLGVMRAGDEGHEPLAPQPGYADVSTLVDGVRNAGLQVNLSVAGEPPATSTALALTMFRLVQEALTNVLKHSGATNVEVGITYGVDGATLVIADDGAGTGGVNSGGHGLVGMRERVALFGGSLDIGARAGGGFRVHAVLPYPEPA